MKKIVIIIVGFLLLVVVSILNSRCIDYVTSDKLYADITSTPKHTVGLIFGTSRINNLGTLNRFFIYRIKQAVELYKAGKIQYILVSGDNTSKSYDEPSDFKEELVRRGIPSDRIVLDYAGLSTRDSVARAKMIFDVPDLLLISQDFQIQRGLVACRYRDIDCDGSPTDSISFRIAPRVYIREYGARLKLRYDMLTPQPDIGGDPEQVPWR